MLEELLKLSEHEQANQIRKILNNISPLTRFYLTEFMSFDGGESMCNPEIYDAINEIEDDLSIEPIERELCIGLSLKSVNVKVFLKEEGNYSDVDYEILDDK